MSDYGFRVINDYGSTTISSLNKVLVYSQRGSFSITSKYTDRPGYGAIVFSRPVLTAEPPQLFFRWVSGSLSSITVYITMTGGAGYWTGCNVISGAGGSVLQDHNIEYVVCQTVSTRATSDFGLEVFDSNESITYNSDARVVKYSQFTKHWEWVRGSVSDPIAIIRSNLVIAPDEFVSVTSFNRGVNWFAQGTRYVTLQLRSGGSPVVNILWQYAPRDWYWGETGGTCFSIPICKFPISRYHD
mgnify:CR=1 FL=1